MRRHLLALLLIVPAAAASAEVSGSALVMDGDTLTVAEHEVTLLGIHAPSITQYCGQGDDMWACGWDAANRLEEIVGGREVTCTDLVDDGHGHFTGRCTAEGEDLAGLMIDAGFAVSDATHGRDYAEREMAASESGIGIWSGPFTDPVTWAEAADCGCTARKQAMMETAALLKAQREADEAAAAEAATQ